MQDMTTFLQEGRYPTGLDRDKMRNFRLQSIPYFIVDGILLRKDFNGVLLRCIEANQVSKLLNEFHDGSSSGHFSTRTTIAMIMRTSYYWQTFFNDTHKWVKDCKKYALFSRKKSLASLPLHPIQVDQPFTQWGLDFIGMINPPSSAGHKWILTTIDYFTRWKEVVALKDATDALVLEFLNEIFTRFGTPSTIILDNSKAFTSS